MPKIATYKNLVFYLVAQDLKERWHLHIINNPGGYVKSAKIWLDNAEVFEKGNLSEKEIALAVELIEDNKELLQEAISEFEKGNRTKTLKLKLK